MPLDPQLEQFFAHAPAFAGVRNVTLAELRDYVRTSSTAFPPLTVPLASVADRTIAGPGGALPVRIYTPEGPGPFPIIVYFHGGGWVVGDLDTQDMIARGLAHGAQAVTVSVDYRLAPEHPFPAAVDDCWAATLWAAANAAELNADPARIAVAGDSAGGSLAAGIALRARDENGPAIAAQLLIYGACNYPSEDTPSSIEFADAALLSRDDSFFFWHHYLRAPETDQHHPWASPYRAESHVGLPPAFIVTAEMDPTRDASERYGARLQEAGVSADIRRHPGMVHGFVSWLGVIACADRAMAEATGWLKQQLA